MTPGFQHPPRSSFPPGRRDTGVVSRSPLSRASIGRAEGRQMEELAIGAAKNFDVHNDLPLARVEASPESDFEDVRMRQRRGDNALRQGVRDVHPRAHERSLDGLKNFAVSDGCG